MEVVRVYDPARRPPNSTDLITPTSFAVFAVHADTGAATDAEGAPFAAPSDVTCLVFESLAAARAFCEAQVERLPWVRFDVFEGGARVDAPILSIVSRARAQRLESSPRALRARRWVAIALFVGAVPLIYYDATERGVLVLPTFLGVSMILAGLRILFMNQAIRDVERTRRERLQRHE
jgi:hypothetical protein